MEENKEIPLKEKVDIIFESIAPKDKKERKAKEIKLPRRARVKGRRLKKGWIGVVRIEENMSMHGERKKIEGSAFQTKDETYHATNGSEVVFWKGKFPVLFQPTWKTNPINFKKENNETYGQKYIMARMLKDATLGKKKIGANWILWLVGIGVAVFVVNKLITGGI